MTSAHTRKTFMCLNDACAHAKPLRDSTARLFSHVVSRDEPWRGGRNIFYTIIKRLFCTGIFTETCKECFKTLKNVNINLPDPNSQHSLEETILGFIPCLPECAASRHPHPPTQRIRCISLIKGEFQVEFASLSCQNEVFARYVSHLVCFFFFFFFFVCNHWICSRLDHSVEQSYHWKLS